MDFKGDLMLYVLLACRVTATEKIPKETGSSLDDDTACIPEGQ